MTYLCNIKQQEISNELRSRCTIVLARIISKISKKNKISQNEFDNYNNLFNSQYKKTIVMILKKIHHKININSFIKGDYNLVIFNLYLQNMHDHNIINFLNMYSNDDQILILKVIDPISVSLMMFKEI